MEDLKRQSPAAARNRDPILEVLRAELPRSGTVFEVASGTGEHAVHFARALPDLVWRPSDPDPEALASIAAWRAAEGPGNLLEPQALDVCNDAWPAGPFSAVVCINMLHISPWPATEALMAGAAGLLEAGHPLVVYGPFRRLDRPLEPGNAAFDADLRGRDSRWGLRSVEDVRACALDQGLVLDRVVDMPANNLTLVFRKR